MRLLELLCAILMTPKKKLSTPPSALLNGIFGSTVPPGGTNRTCALASVACPQRSTSTPCEPPPTKLTLKRDDKSGVGKIVLRRDGLQGLVREPLR